ncbi:unnamed protein product [Protopolystoma xenopodis]|uniref:Uncharacterized protein n=1 Tax=Protopolystoma xenopodis TaxID=117903 RepID=A0A3S5AQH5_9PLAT|nr:unnamed protein product [Protopolystoma xenopodis]
MFARYKPKAPKPHFVSFIDKSSQPSGGLGVSGTEKSAIWCRQTEFGHLSEGIETSMMAATKASVFLAKATQVVSMCMWGCCVIAVAAFRGGQECQQADNSLAHRRKNYYCIRPRLCLRQWDDSPTELTNIANRRCLPLHIESTHLVTVTPGVDSNPSQVNRVIEPALLSVRYGVDCFTISGPWIEDKAKRNEDLRSAVRFEIPPQMPSSGKL